VFDVLLDAGKVAACLPGSRLIGEVADGTYAGQIEVRIGPINGVHAGAVRLDAADRKAGTVLLRASGRERAGQGSADAHLAVRVEPDGATARVLISADLLIRGQVAQYAQGAVGHVSQRLIEQFASNVERLLASQPGASAVTAPRLQHRWRSRPPRRPRPCSLPGCSSRWPCAG
jgi:uncharacterized protein